MMVPVRPLWQQSSGMAINVVIRPASEMHASVGSPQTRGGTNAFIHMHETEGMHKVVVS
jgi:hypothetical protein